ncbi:MAG: cupredoxin family protein [Boseongicola sp.]|nr:cupredoxin family protein [Rhodospirillaceae bacterium]MDD9921686.1 cupredoxin family protein [Boseongicola sp.]MDD9978677.1 cupredoxin family protein [Boseongicola sp.]
MTRLNTLTKGIAASIILGGVALNVTSATAGGTHKGGHAFGEAGDPSKATRTINIVMHDNYYEPENITAKPGETIRFTIKNAGDFVHEFNIGTAKMHAAHQEEMMMMVEHGVLEPDKINHEMMKMDMGNGQTMEHDDPNSILLEPGKSGEIVWKFTEATSLEFACNIPGHYDSGMVGQLSVKKPDS